MLALRRIVIPVGEFYRSLLHTARYCAIDSLGDSPRIINAQPTYIVCSGALVWLILLTSFQVQMITAKN